MVTVCGVSGTMGKEGRPAEVEKQQGSLFSVNSDLTVTKHLNQVTPPVCLSVSHQSVCLSPDTVTGQWVNGGIPDSVIELTGAVSSGRMDQLR